MIRQDASLSALVKQFADPYAFLRELVQNALDAGSNEIDVSFEYDAGSKLSTIAVQDFGGGMDREIIETRLTRMFSSGKDGDQTKIGRFGIGFISVFAVEPELLCVDTARGGQRWRVLIQPDLSYELLPLTEPFEGTRVRLLKRMEASEHVAARARAIAALRAWCRYVDAELRVDGDLINEDFFKLSPCQVSRRHDDGTRIVVGYVSLEAGAAGFYNRGLTIWQRRHSGHRHVAFRIDSPRLEHTVSRDNVLQDERHDALVAEVAQMVETELPRALFAALDDARAGLHHRAFLQRTAANYLRVRAGELAERLPSWIGSCRVLPMLHGPPLTVTQARAAVRRRRLFVAERPSPITEKLHARGDAVVEAAEEGLVAELLRSLGCEPVAADRHFCTALPVAVDELMHFEALRGALLRLLGEDAPTRVQAGHLDYPASAVREWIAIKQDEPFELTPMSRASLGSSDDGPRCVVLNVDHPQIARLLALSAREPELCAYIVAKLAMLRGTLDSGRDARFAVHTLEARWTRCGG